MKSQHKFFGHALVLALIVLGTVSITDSNVGQAKPVPAKPAPSQSQEEPPPVRMGLEPKAMEILKAASNRLAAARTMNFTAVTTYESPSRLGTPIAYTTTSNVTLQRPDKLRVITLGDGPATEFYYNGKTITAFAPVENLVAIAPAPSSIDAVMKTIYDSAAIYFPFTDLIVSDPYKDMAEGLILAFYIGQSKQVGGTTTDMVAFANNDVFIQAWIGTEDKLPRRLRAVYRTDAAGLRHQLDLSNWQLDIPVAVDAFRTTKASSAKPIPFANPQARPQGAKPPVKGSSSQGN